MTLDEIQKTFSRNVKSVQKLMNFDRDVQDFYIEQLKDLNTRLKKSGIDNEHLNGERQLLMLQQMRNNDALRTRYETIFNQAVVLSVSLFGSAVHDILRLCVEGAIKDRKHKKLLSEEIKVSISDVINTTDNFEEAISELFISKKDISFQDMQSIVRTFSDYFDIEIERDATVNNIVCGQACRNAIVHTGSRVDARLIRQLISAKPRELKPKLTEGENLKFTTKEVDILCASMEKYIESLLARIKQSG